MATIITDGLHSHDAVAAAGPGAAMVTATQNNQPMLPQIPREGLPFMHPGSL
jgi:hypothetical protein